MVNEANHENVSIKHVESAFEAADKIVMNAANSVSGFGTKENRKQIHSWGVEVLNHLTFAHDGHKRLAERCERLEAALRALRTMCADNLELGAEGPAYWEDCGDVINEALSGSSGGKDG